MTEESNFKLDTRIKNIDDIQTIIFNNHGSIGCKGYFFDNFVQAKVLTKTHYGTLVDIDIVGGSDHCFKARDENGNDFIGYYRFFIPEDALKPAEKKYRPYKDVEEFFNDIGCNVGDVIQYRRKNDGTKYRSIIIGTSNKDGYELVFFCNKWYSMKELFDLCEVFRTPGVWRPFGIKE